MSDDIDRLKGVLEDLRILNDGLQEGHDAMRDIVAAVKPIELETDPEGHAALRDLANEIQREHMKMSFHEQAYWRVKRDLCAKARCNP